jgi:hypothetical protein
VEGVRCGRHCQASLSETNKSVMVRYEYGSTSLVQLEQDGSDVNLARIAKRRCRRSGRSGAKLSDSRPLAFELLALDVGVLVVWKVSLSSSFVQKR